VEGAQQIDVDVDCLAAAAAVMSSHGLGSGRRLLLATGLGLAAPPPLERPRRHHIHGPWLRWENGVFLNVLNLQLRLLAIDLLNR
jgi:hypothetical protein